MKNEQFTLWGLCCFSMLEIQGDLYTFAGENESHRTGTIFKLICDNHKCKWSQFFSWSWIPAGFTGSSLERSHLVAIPVPDSFCT